MKTIFLKIIACLLVITSIQAQEDTSWKNIYRGTETKVSDLVHTKLDLHFDYTKSWVYGKAWLTLHPHFYTSDSVILDAKGMAISEVAISAGGKTTALPYTYDKMNLHIRLNKAYHAGENYTLYIRYTAKPNEYKASHPSLMPGEKGLYFINPQGEIKGKPTQIWSQGETEANSYWFPTIDKPNQKTTNEITMTVASKYQTLSNGLLVSQKTNTDGTRTDTWKMDLPHAPYLIFIGVGEYAVIKDHYKNKEVNYYVEKEYAPYAKKIFGNTPEMMTFFSKITGVDYPWPKYAQITGRDYIFGAMENTSATLHEEGAQLDARELIDGNAWEEIIAHELFHQWFGDYVTTESWSNTTLNESFADYSETLWSEYKYGKDAGQAHIYADRRTYFSDPSNVEKPLVRFHYDNALDIFDGVSYQKGGAILHMLRNYVGEEAFSKSLQLYLTTNKFGNGEAHQLRMAFEQVTGQDLNWFFNQWYYRAGHPKLDISYSYDNATTKVIIRQLQPNLFKLPIAIDVYQSGTKKRYQVWANNAADTFSFPVTAKPDLVNVDADNILVTEKTDHKTAENFIYQYHNAGQYGDRREAIFYFVNHRQEPKRLNFLSTGLADKNELLRKDLLNALVTDFKNDTTRAAFEGIVKDMAQHDAARTVRAAAIRLLSAGNNSSAYRPIFDAAVNDSSYAVAGAGLNALGKTDSAAAFAIARKLVTGPSKRMLYYAIIYNLARSGTDADFNLVYHAFEQASVQIRLGLLEPLSIALSRTRDTEQVKKQISILVAFRDQLPAFLAQSGNPEINERLKAIAAAQLKAGNKELADYISSNVSPE